MKQCGNCDKDSICLLKECNAKARRLLNKSVNIYDSLFDFVDIGIMCKFFESKDGKIQELEKVN